MRCQRCGRPVEGAGRLCAQCAGAVRRSSGVSGGRRPGRQASSAGSRPVPSVRSAGSRPVPSARSAGTAPAAGSPPRRRRRRASAKGWLFLLLLFAAFLAGYLLNSAGREPARPDGDVSRSQAVSPSAVSCCNDSGAAVASSAVAISSALHPVSAASSDSFGSLPNAAHNLCRADQTLCPFSRRVRPTFTGPSSRRNRRISPAIFGTA